MNKGEKGQGSELSKEIGNYRQLRESRTHMAGAFLPGNPETMGHKGDLVNRLLPAWSHSIYHTKVNMLTFPSWSSLSI